MVRVDGRLIRGRGQLWIRSLGVNLVVYANDKAAEDSLQQTLVKAIVPKEINIHFWTIECTAETTWKAAPGQTIFVVVGNLYDALELCKLGFLMEQLNVGNIHADGDKEKISQLVYLDEEDK